MKKAKTLKKRANGTSTSYGVYAAYVFLPTEKDPAIDELRTVAQDVLGGEITWGALRSIHDEGGPSTTCMAQWFWGKTRRPTNSALEAAGRALGFQRKWVKMKGDK